MFWVVEHPEIRDIYVLGRNQGMFGRKLFSAVVLVTCRLYNVHVLVWSLPTILPEWTGRHDNVYFLLKSKQHLPQHTIGSSMGVLKFILRPDKKACHWFILQNRRVRLNKIFEIYHEITAMCVCMINLTSPQTGQVNPVTSPTHRDIWNNERTVYFCFT